MSPPPSVGAGFRPGVCGALACAGLVLGCARGHVAAPATASPVASTAPAARLPPVSLPLHAVIETSIDTFPTHFDPSGRLIAHCDQRSCDVWERGPDGFRGTVASSRCAGWVEPVPKPAAQNPDATLAVVREGEAITLRKQPSGSAIALLGGAAAAGCEVGATAWAADGSALAFRCDGSLVVFDAHTGAVVDRTLLLPATSFDYVWRDRLVVALRNETDQSPGWPTELLTWKGPGKSDWARVGGEYIVDSILLDPVTGDAWVSSSVGGCECAVEALDGPDGEHSRWDSKDSCSSSSEQRVQATNPTGDAFVIETRERHRRGTVSIDVRVVRLHPQFGECVAWGETYPGEEEEPTERPYHVALSRDGTWLVVVADPAARSPRVVLVAREVSNTRLELDAAALDKILRGAPIDDVDLTDDEQAAIITSKNVTVVLPLDGKAKARRLTPSEVESVHRRDAPSAAFATEDGQLFTRLADEVRMRRDGCWFPETWNNAPLETLRVLAGEDAVNGRLLDRKQVEAHFCQPARFGAFLRGEPMPPRPDARWTAR